MNVSNHSPPVTLPCNKPVATHVCDSECGEIVPLAIFAATHAIARAGATGAATQRRWHVRTLLASTCGTNTRLQLVGICLGPTGSGLANRRHRVLVRAARGEMLAVADTALDLLVLEFVLHGLGVDVLALVLGILAPVGRWLEDNVLADGRSIRGRAGAILDALAELGPALAIRNAGVDDLAVGDETDSPRGLHLLVLIVVVVLDNGGAAILVGDLLRGREDILGHLLAVDIVGPVVPATVVLVLRASSGLAARGLAGGLLTWQLLPSSRMEYRDRCEVLSFVTSNGAMLKGPAIAGG